MGNEILRSKAASNCALTDIYKNIYVFKKKMYRTVNERKSDAKTKTKQNSVTAKRNQQILTWNKNWTLNDCAVYFPFPFTLLNLLLWSCSCWWLSVSTHQSARFWRKMMLTFLNPAYKGLSVNYFSKQPFNKRRERRWITEDVGPGWGGQFCYNTVFKVFITSRYFFCFLHLFSFQMIFNALDPSSLCCCLSHK